MAKREVDKRKTAKALRKLRRVTERTAEPDAPKLTPWEQEFVAGVSTRLETYGSAFRDLSKGRAEEALSARQADIARVLDRKSRPKAEKPAKAGKTPEDSGKPDKGPGGFRRSSFKPKAPPPSRARVRQIDEDIGGPGDTAQAAAPLPMPGPPQLRVIKGGRSGA